MDQIFIFYNHIVKLKKSCFALLNFFKKLAHTSYGDTTYLLYMYHSFFRFRCNYCVPIYSAETKTYLNLLITSGIFPNTAYINFYLLSSEYLQDLRPQFLFLWFIFRLQKSPRTSASEKKLSQNLLWKTIFFQFRNSCKITWTVNINNDWPSCNSSNQPNHQRRKTPQIAFWTTSAPTPIILRTWDTSNYTHHYWHDVVIYCLLTCHIFFIHQFLFPRSPPPVYSNCR